METVEDIAAEELRNALAAYRNKGLDAAIFAFATALQSYGAARAKEAREGAIKEAARAVSHMFVNDPHAMHPDVAFDQMNEIAQTAAHSTAQCAARIILDLQP